MRGLFSEAQGHRCTSGSGRSKVRGQRRLSASQLRHAYPAYSYTGLVARLDGRPSTVRPLFTFVIARVLRRFPAYTSRHMARLAARVTVDDVTTFKTTAYHYTSRAQSATREPM